MKTEDLKSDELITENPAPMTCAIKICGLSTASTLDAALDAGAEYLGFVFFEPSPRHVRYEQARALGRQVQGRARIVALSVDADDAQLDAIAAHLDPDLFQLHGQETPARAAEIRARYGKPVMKAIKLRDHADLRQAAAYVDAVDMLVYDAMAPASAVLPGGNGLCFDWSILAGRAEREAFMLSGGLDADNVAEAIAIARPAIVDVSSGVETRPGVKDEGLIRRFIAAARAATVAA